jgi:hypothetical protein
MRDQMLDVAVHSRKEIVYTQHLAPVAEQAVAQMRAQKTRPIRH